MANSVSLHQDLAQVLCTQHIPQGSLSEEPRGTFCVFHIGDGHGGVIDSEVNHCINCYSDTVLSQNLQINNEKTYLRVYFQP